MNAPESAEVMLRVRGTVQGVGFRPFVLQTARRLGLRGWVRNDPQGVLVRATGPAEAIDGLAHEIRTAAPRAARVTAVERLPVPSPESVPSPGFEIMASDPEGAAVETAAPPDLALCPDCRRELADPADRRHGYPFVNCTQCGPRYSILEALPYDRPATTMRAFAMCPSCQAEYDDPAGRRHHAQPNACPVCGPRLALTDPAGTVLGRDGAAIEAAATALKAGRIVAVKGIGGFHLMADARNGAAVSALRMRKQRDEKPFAVLFAAGADVAVFAETDAAAVRLLESPAAPIVLLRARAEPRLAAGVAPGNPWLGAMVASSPLHVLLANAFAGPLVATSGNPAEEPLCTDDAESRARLGELADLFLGHDRGIARPVDDSVVRFTARGEPIPLRRARGYAPTPLGLPAAFAEPLLCVGAQMKSTVAVAAGDRLVLSPHLGDLGNAATQALFGRTIEMLGALHRAKFAGVVHDKHPDYASTAYARRSGLPMTGVQHHLAHVLSCLLEHRHSAHGVLGVCWDGTGWGEDGTIWGGEFILLEQGTAKRFGHLRPFRLAGGEAAVRDARRVALALAREAEVPEWAALAERLGVGETEREVLAKMLGRGLNSPVCSSMGRLFDGFGALLGLGTRNAFEGQVPLAVEAAAIRAGGETAALPFAVEWSGTPATLQVDWRPAVRQAAIRGGDPATAAAAFHRGLVQALVAVARRSGADTVALTGGCFQNALLAGLVAEALRAAGFVVLLHRELPPNDGGIAAGQALGALWQLTSVEKL